MIMIHVFFFFFFAAQRVYRVRARCSFYSGDPVRWPARRVGVVVAFNARSEKFWIRLAKKLVSVDPE